MYGHTGFRNAYFLLLLNSKTEKIIFKITERPLLATRIFHINNIFENAEYP